LTAAGWKREGGMGIMVENVGLEMALVCEHFITFLSGENGFRVSVMTV